MNTNGIILWEGKSKLADHRQVNIVVIAVGLKDSKNRKTGKMLQTYILLQDVDPVEAIKLGFDGAICGKCVHRGDKGFSGRTCYVNVGQGVMAVWRCYERGNYPKVESIEDIRKVGEGRKVRLGTYGDPMAVPAEIWEALISRSAMHTGYTHQWKRARGARWQKLVMASADTLGDKVAAHAKGWRTFRVNRDGVKTKGEAHCPASEEMGKILQCDTCGACNGTRTGRKGSITIAAHGSQASERNLDKLEARIILAVAA